MIHKYLKKTFRNSRDERGVVLIAVLMFIAMILPITLLILDSVRIESLLPVNEAFTKTAGDEADKGFHEALAAIMEDQDIFQVDVTRDPLDPAQDYWVNTDQDSWSGKHEYDYLSELWARHPDNDTIFLVERSLENIELDFDSDANPDADPDDEIHSVPARWQLMNVPFGMDDFGEYYFDGSDDYPRLLLPFEYVGENNLTKDELNAPAYYVDPSEMSMLNVQHEPTGGLGNTPAQYGSFDLEDYWKISAADPNYYENLNNLDPVYYFIPRPASYFRNTNGTPDIGLGAVGLPSAENSFNPGFVREDNDAIDRLVYDGLYDYDDQVNQYLGFLPLQQAVTDSTWANPFFGLTSGTSSLDPTRLFVTSNKEYKPTPGTLTPYQLGTDEESVVPGWHQAIVSDEAGRFPINNLLNIIFASDNIDYNDPEEPWSRRDQFDDITNIEDLMFNEDHPNYGGYLMARDILISLMMDDGDMARMADSWDQNTWNQYEEMANWIIRQMLHRRLQLDETSDYNRNGDPTDDESAGEIFGFPEYAQNNDSPTLDISPPGIDLIDGSGRLGDGQDLWDGTWRIYTNPRELLTDFIGEDPPAPGSRRLNRSAFETLNQRITMYSMDTEYTADPDHPVMSSPLVPLGGIGARPDIRHNINKMAASDNFQTSLIDESALYDLLSSTIGRARVESIMNWRDGLVDLNGDGDLNDEYIEQPVSAQLFDPTEDTAPEPYFPDAGDLPVSTVTYRERNHPNFQDPSLDDHLIDPDLLNIRSLGDLITIPMSTGEGIIAYTEAQNTGGPYNLVIRRENGSDPAWGPTSIANRYYPDFASQGTDLAYDDQDEIYTNDNFLANENSLVNNAKHASYGNNDTVIGYYNNSDDINYYDIINDSTNTILNNADLPPDITDTTGLDFWGLWPNNLIGSARFEMASPDISPSATNSEVAFSQVATADDTFLDPDVAYNLVTSRLDGSVIDVLTDNADGIYDYGPDFSPDGQWIVFTRTSYEYFNWSGLSGQVDPIPVTTLMLTDRQGNFAIPLHAPWDVEPGLPTATEHFFDIADFDLVNQTIDLRMHQPMFPNWAPNGEDIIFMDLVVTFRLDISDPANPPYPISAVDVDSDIYTMEAFLPFQNWAQMRSVDVSDGPLEMFPDWSLGSISLSAQNDTQIGTVGGSPIDMTSAQTATTDVTPPDVSFTETERQAIARSIGYASLALRRSIGWGADEQNWRLMDLPAVPEHVVDVLEEIADVVCFRDAFITHDPDYDNTDPFATINVPPLQAYPGRVNINTATRPVLRSVMMLMFQGPDTDADDDDDPNGPHPRSRSGTGFNSLNVMNPDIDDDDQLHFEAIMIADRYAHQICEYRKWIYNNVGHAGLTDETVASSLPLYEERYNTLDPPVSHYGNFRANPFYPLIDTDGDGQAPDILRTSPDPPFRSIADLFKVALYDDRVFSEDWTYEGIDGFGGPDDTYIPEPIDDTGTNVGTIDAYDVFGPIYNASDERNITHDANGALMGGTMYGYESQVDNDYGDPFYNNFHEHQWYRLFSADDFRRVAPWLTVRTYNYRIESRGVVRISSGAQRTDIYRDKVWIITTNTEANFHARLNPTWDLTVPFDSSFRAQNRGTDQWYILYFEETPQAGIPITRNEFLPQ